MSQYEWPTATAPEPPRYELATWGARAGAVLLDTLIIMLGALAIGLVIGVSSNPGDGGREASLAVLYLAFALYAPLMLAFNHGQTLGKKALSIAVIRADGEPIGFWRAVWRELVARWLLGILIIPAFLDVLWPLWDDENRALHDMMASTRVIAR